MKTLFSKLFQRIVNFLKAISAALAPYKKNIIIPLLKILGVIIVCALLVRFWGGHETLADYAEKNPEIAYGISGN